MLEVEGVQKESKKVNGQYTFVSHDAVAKALHKPMANAGIMMLPSLEELTQDGNRTQVIMGMTFINIDMPEDKCYIRSAGQGIDPQDKGIGKAVSYAVKYGLLKAFCLETGDDVEKDNYEHKPAVKSTLLTLEQMENIMSLVGEDKEGLAKLLAFFQVTHLKNIPAECYDRILQAIYKKKKTESQGKVTSIQQEAF
jgi:hypothetical protein